ncbi:MAG TPA: hypothetical protein ENG87_03200 [Candidatus Pacearchaeota archaeon]|nr:hypothetical protein [Candidatus Pacearchaeota archaeon]HDZ61178.1 hypothetical protein [Candidatus Pacearchaeota archaeon]
MAYTISITIALICLAGIFLLLSKAFAQNQRGIKTLFVMFCLGVCVLLAQVVKIIVETNASGTALTNLNLMTTSTLTVTIVLFIFFMLYFFITYTRDLFHDLRNVKKTQG